MNSKSRQTPPGRDRRTWRRGTCRPARVTADPADTGLAWDQLPTEGTKGLQAGITRNFEDRLGLQGGILKILFESSREDLPSRRGGRRPETSPRGVSARLSAKYAHPTLVRIILGGVTPTSPLPPFNNKRPVVSGISKAQLIDPFPFLIVLTKPYKLEFVPASLLEFLCHPLTRVGLSTTTATKTRVQTLFGLCSLTFLLGPVASKYAF